MALCHTLFDWCSAPPLTIGGEMYFTNTFKRLSLPASTPVNSFNSLLVSTINVVVVITVCFCINLCYYHNNSSLVFMTATQNKDRSGDEAT